MASISALVLLVPLTFLLLLFFPFLPAWGIHPAVLHEAIPYFKALVWGLLPLLLFCSFRRYLQAMNQVKPILFAMISANLMNAFGNWVLIFGKLGAPAMGAEGAGWSTTLSRVYMMTVLLVAIVWHESRERTGLWQTPLKLEPARIGRLLRLGCPAAMQITLEVGVFAAATALAGRLTPVALAAHQIAMQVASLTFMVPLGMASAGAVRVGQALGRHDPEAAEHSGWMALMLGAGFMGLAGLGLVSMPQFIMRIFTIDAAVISLGFSLLLLAAVFQLFDGVAGGGDGSPARDGRYANADGLQPHWPLVDWTSDRLCLLFSVRLGCLRTLGWTVSRLDSGGCGPALGLVANSSGLEEDMECSPNVA